MFYKFKTSLDLYDPARIFVQIIRLTGNNPDNGVSFEGVDDMIINLLPRKEEKIYNEINHNNIAEHLLRCIPTGSFVEIKLKADLNDPVKTFFFLL
jgi:hypothetical protein